ncbi:MAG: peptidyl-prolyl cis-trans isomerase C, partial [bacterium]
MLIAQNQSLGGGKLNITAKDMESWFKMLPPEQLRGMSTQPEAKKALVDNLKEMFILSLEAEKMGLATAPDAQSELSIMEKVALAGVFRSLKGAENPTLVQVSEEEKQQFLKKSPNAFDEFIASSPRLKTVPEAQREALKPQFAELMILLDRAKKSGIEKDPGYQMTFRVQRASYLAVRAQQQIRGTLPVTDEEIKKEFDEVKGNYAETRARHILIMFPDQRKQRDTAPKAEDGKEGEKEAKEISKIPKPATKEEAQKLAQELLVRIKEKKEDFAELAKQYSDDPGSGKMGGDLGYFKKDVGFVPEFKDALFKLQPNQTSDLVETQFGYHIIQVTEQKPAPDKPDEALKLELKDKVLDK